MRKKDLNKIIAWLIAACMLAGILPETCRTTPCECCPALCPN
ncbi:MAG: hypothetical protein VB106_07090 [Clostridiaceae bacterium]|nr:hypothetical protein [Clostridiaceae bacterium]